MRNQHALRLVASATTLAAFGLVVAWQSTARANPPGPAPRNADFNNDGYDDVAVGDPEDDTEADDAGAVSLVYGSSTGPATPAYTLRFTQDTSGVEGAPEADDYFGHALAWGDFNADGYDDLAIGAPYEDVSGAACEGDNGAVHVIYGGANGLSATNSPADTLWHGDTSGITAYDADCNDYFGWELTVGFFDDDEYDDLAIAIEGDDVSSVSSAGSVLILYGSSNGITATGHDFFHQGSTNMAGDGNQSSDRWSRVIVAGDFDCDGIDDLAVGAPNEDLTGGNDAGAVTVLYGTASGMSASGSEWFNQDTGDVDGAPELGDLFGGALAAGNFNADTVGLLNCMDLAVGAPGEGIVDGGSEQSAAGAVTLLLGGGAGGLTGTGSQLLYEGLGSLAGSPESGANFGDSLTVGHLNDDVFDDLVIGGGDATCDGVGFAGEIFVLKGAAFGVTTVNSVNWSQATSGIADTCESSDSWGGELWFTNTFAWFRGDDEDRYLVVGNLREDNEGSITNLRLTDGQTNPTLAGSTQWFSDDSGGAGLSPEFFGFTTTRPRNVYRAN